MNLPFVKMHGLGNDFVIIDERRASYGLQPAQLAYIADRREGVGCDQVLFLEPAADPRAHARYRVANADGSPAEHCGNGIRCIARLLQRLGEIERQVRIEIGDAVFELAIESDGRVRVDMGVPRFAPAVLPLRADREQDTYRTRVGTEAIEFGAVSMGNPHAVIEVAATAHAEVGRIGPAVQASDLFPAGVNVGFMQIRDPQAISLRVYERGAGETRACGTGACAAVAIGRRWGRLGPRVEVDLPGGALSIEWQGGANDPVWMTGPATYVFEGTITL